MAETTTLRDKAMAENPDFPWLEADDVARVARVARERGWLKEDEELVSCAKAGEGNMNLTLRLKTNGRTLILKQARPWVEKYPSIAAPWDRMIVEQRFYRRVSEIPEAAERMPKVLGADDAARVILLEDLGEAADYTGIYAGEKLAENDLASIASYLHALHEKTRGDALEAFQNRDMRALNHAHIFVIPLSPDNGLEIDQFEPGLDQAATELMNDEAYCTLVEETGARYLADGPCLVHGDSFPGSWLKTDSGPKIIDPEFCFCGDPEFDLGVTLAHLIMGRQGSQLVHFFLDAYRGRGKVSVNHDRVVRYAATEIMRRLIGVAQLPIPPSDGFRKQLLVWSRQALFQQSLEDPPL